MGQDHNTNHVFSDFANDEEYQDLIELFVNSIPDKINQIKQFHQDKDFEKLKFLSHQLKGAAGGFGFPKLTDIAEDLELVCINKSTDKLDEKVDTLLKYLSSISK